MKNLYLSALLFLLAIGAYAQPESAASKANATQFGKLYNKAAYDSLFLKFSPEMKDALPMAKTKEFLGGLAAQAGKIIRMQFLKYQSGYAAYKTDFEKAVFTVNIASGNDGSISGLSLVPFVPEGPSKRNTTALMLPFRDEWTVVWGGDTKAQNYHVESRAQKNAFDLVITNQAGRSYRTTGKTNEDYYAFGKELIAPADGEIVSVVDGVKDNIPGVMNSFNTGGNTVILKTAAGEYLVFCHFKHRSIKVKEGQMVKTGTLLVQVGNSGHSSEPHIHYHIQDVEDLNTGIGIKSFFKSLTVNGTVKQDYSPVQNDKIKP